MMSFVLSSHGPRHIEDDPGVVVVFDLIDNVLTPEEVRLAPLRDFSDRQSLYRRQDVVFANSKPAIRYVLDPHKNHLIAINKL